MGSNTVKRVKRVQNPSDSVLLGNGKQMQICRFGLPDDIFTYFNPFSLHKQISENESFIFVINVKIWVKLVNVTSGEIV